MKPAQPEQVPPLVQVLGSAAVIDTSRIEGEGPEGRLPLTPDVLRNEPSGNIFGLTQNAGMGWRPDALGGPQYVIVSTMSGLRSEQGEPIALGYHTGHWEIGLLVRGAAEAQREAGAIPFAWIRVNRATPRLVDALPNGPKGHPTAQAFMAGGVLK